MKGYTRYRHNATIGSTKPALCGKKPPRGRAWKEAPEGLPPCQKCLDARPPEWYLAC